MSWRFAELRSFAAKSVHAVENDCERLSLQRLPLAGTRTRAELVKDGQNVCWILLYKRLGDRYKDRATKAVARMKSFFAELQRRHVYKVGAAYAVASWLLVQIVTQVFPIFEVSSLAQRIIVLVIVAGFPMALVLAWLFDITAQGIVRTGELPPSGEAPEVPLPLNVLTISWRVRK